MYVVDTTLHTIGGHVLRVNSLIFISFFPPCYFYLLLTEPEQRRTFGAIGSLFPGSQTGSIQHRCEDHAHWECGRRCLPTLRLLDDVDGIRWFKPLRQV